MTLRTKSIEFPFISNTSSLTAATRYDFTSTTLYSPENSSRTFRSAIIEISARDNESSAGAYLSSFMIGIKLGAAAFDDNTVTRSIAQFNTSSPKTLFFTRDVTSYFNTNFGSGTSQTCQVGVQFGGNATININAKLILTYEYDDSGQTTRIKTVRIPFDGSVTSMTATLAELGTNQIPNLSTFLPEASKTFRQVWFEIVGNENGASTTDFQLGLALDAEAEVNDGLHEQALTGSPFYKYIWIRNDMTTNAAHAFKMRTTVASRMNLTAVTLCVTYEYNHSSSTSIMNSLLLPLRTDGSGLMGFSSSASANRMKTSYFVEETNPSLVQSGIYTQFHLSSDAGTFSGLNMRVGSQSYRAYSLAYSTFELAQGDWVMQQRVDSGGAQGAGITLARGENNIIVDCYNTSTQDKLSGMTSYAIINYTSDKHTNGDGVHNHTTFWNIISSAASGANTYDTAVTSSSVAANIPETNFYISNLGFRTLTMCNPIRSNSAINLCAATGSGELNGAGWTTVLINIAMGGSEITNFEQCSQSVSFNRYPNDPMSRLDCETARVFRTITSFNNIFGAYMILTYHAITFLVQGSASNYAGTGGSIGVRLYRSDTNEMVATTTTATGGGFSITWYDNTINMFVEGREDATHRGRSDNTTAS